MLVLLPPSEGKAPGGGRRRPVDLTALSFPSLTPTRERVLDALTGVSARDDAVDVLGVGPSLEPEVRRNTALRTAPALPAGRVYTGVLYDALDLAGLGTAARRRAARSVVVVSALWGALRPGDAVPPYRLSMGTDLPGVGPLAAAWRPALDDVLTDAAGHGVVVDCRSSTYAAAWAPRDGVADRTVAVRVLREHEGRRSVVSHMAKHTRGLVTRHLLEVATAPRTVRQVAAAVGERWTAELHEPPRTGRPWTLDVVVTD